MMDSAAMNQSGHAPKGNVSMNQLKKTMLRPTAAAQLPKPNAACGGGIASAFVHMRKMAMPD